MFQTCFIRLSPYPERSILIKLSTCPPSKLWIGFDIHAINGNSETSSAGRPGLQKLGMFRNFFGTWRLFEFCDQLFRRLYPLRAQRNSMDTVSNTADLLQITAGWLVVAFFTLEPLRWPCPSSQAPIPLRELFITGVVFSAVERSVGSPLVSIRLGSLLYWRELIMDSRNSDRHFPLERRYKNHQRIYALLLLSHAVLNHFGIRLVAWLNDLSAWYHIAVVLILVEPWISRLCSTAFFLFTFNHTDGFNPTYSMLIGLLLAQWTLSGYDASAHVSEETVDPRRNAPWAFFSRL